MQQNSMKCCIRQTSPFLSASLIPDNLARICNNDSDKLLRGELQVRCRNCQLSAAMVSLTATSVHWLHLRPR